MGVPSETVIWETWAGRSGSPYWTATPGESGATTLAGARISPDASTTTPTAVAWKGVPSRELAALTMTIEPMGAVVTAGESPGSSWATPLPAPSMAPRRMDPSTAAAQARRDLDPIMA